MAAQKPVLPLQDMTDEQRAAWIKKAPVPVRAYIEYLESEIEAQDELLYGEKRAQDYGQSLSALWTHVAFMRAASGDDAGATRAFFAAGVFRS